MVDYIHALEYPFLNKENIKHFVIGGILNIFWFLLIPFIFILGYLIKLIQETIKGEGNMPDWAGWREIFKHGVVALGISIAYFIIPIAIISASSFFFQIPNEVTVDALATVPIYGIPFLLLGTITFLFVMFIYPMVLIQYAITENYKKAFDIPEIFTRIRKRLFGYLATYAIAMGLYTLFLLAGVILNIFVGFLMFYPLIFITHTFTQIYTESL